MKPIVEENDLDGGFTQIIIRQTSTDGMHEATLVLQNYHDGYVSISNGEDGVLITRDAADEVAKRLRKLSTMEIRKANQ